MAYTSAARLAVEAGAVAAGLVLLFLAVRLVLGDDSVVASVALAGALFHVGCEYTGLNAWYCAHRPPSD